MEAIRTLLEPITAAFQAARKASTIDFYEPLKGGLLDENMARCARSVSPTFLPLVYGGGDLFGLHIEPGVPLSEAHVSYWSHDDQGLRVFGRGLGYLPICLYLEGARGFAGLGRTEQFLKFLDVVVRGIPGGVPLPPALLARPTASLPGSTWEPSAVPESDPYLHARHPFAGMPAASSRSGAPALAAVEAFIAAHGDADPHTRGLLAGATLRALRPLQPEQAITFLPYECHYYQIGADCPGFTTAGRGIVHWDKVLSNKNAPTWLTNTPLEPLLAVPNAYACQDAEGVKALLAVADNYRALGDREKELGTLRNAATVAVATTRSCPKALSTRIAEACDAIEAGGLATALTLAYVDARKIAP